MLTRIRNANSVYHEKVEIPGSKIKVAIADVLKREGYIKDYSFAEDNKQGILTVKLKYGAEREKVITGIKRISRPGLRQYSKRKEFLLAYSVVKSAANHLSSFQTNEFRVAKSISRRSQRLLQRRLQAISSPA